MNKNTLNTMARTYASKPENHGLFDDVRYEFGEPVVYDIDDIDFVERGYIAGYIQSEKDNLLHWSDIEEIMNLYFSENPDGLSDDPSMYQRVADRFNRTKRRSIKQMEK